MKKVIVLAGIVLMMAACNKDEIKKNENCNCGVIQSDNVEDYSVVIRNSCSGNNKTFILSQGDWMNAHPGDELCISNETNW
jgi:hypothetical protein